MLSLTFNAPRDAFDDPSQEFFGGKSVDDLFWPAHLNFKFFEMTPLETFACYDVMKNPQIESDLVRFDEHLERHFPAHHVGVEPWHSPTIRKLDTGDALPELSTRPRRGETPSTSPRSGGRCCSSTGVDW